MANADFSRSRRLLRSALAAALAFILVALAPGLAPYEAAALVFNGSMGSAGRGLVVPAVPAGAANGGGVVAIPVGAVLAPALSSVLTFGAAPSASFIPSAAPSAAALPALPSSALFAPPSAAPSAAGGIAVSNPAAAHSAVPASASASADEGRGGAPETARGLLSRTVESIESAPDADAKSGFLDKLFSGAWKFFGRGAQPSAASPSSFSALTPRPAVLARPAVSAPGQAETDESRATPPSPVGLEGPGLQPGDKFLSGSAAPAAAPAPVGNPKGDDWIDVKGVVGMFIQRSISISAFILTSLAYPLIAIHAVGILQFGALMALGPIIASGTGPLNGFIADRMSPRNGMLLLCVLRGLLTFALPVFAHFGILSFGPLLLASIANGWQMSLLMTSENAFFRRMVGKNKIQTVTSLTSVNYMLLQVALTLLLGVGAFIDKWNLMVPFVSSTILNLTVVPLFVWFMVPNIVPDAVAGVAAAARSAGERARSLWEGAKSFFKRYWKEIGLLGAATGAYFLWHSPLPLSAALVWWVSRTDSFKTVWSQKGLRATMLLSALSLGLIVPFQSMVLPLMAAAIGGTAGKAVILGQLLGAFFFGQLVSNASQAKLPEIRVPFTKKTVPAQSLIQGVVLVMGAAWSFLRLFPGSWPAAAGAAAAGALLMFGASKFTARGWLKFVGVGLAASALLPLVFWGSMPAIFAGMLALGLFAGPASVALNSYFSRNAQAASIGNAFGVDGSLINSATSFGFGLVTLLAGLFHPTFPGIFGPILAAFVAVGAVFHFAPKFLPGLPDKSFSSPEKTGDKK